MNVPAKAAAPTLLSNPPVPEYPSIGLPDIPVVVERPLEVPVPIERPASEPRPLDCKLGRGLCFNN